MPYAPRDPGDTLTVKEASRILGISAQTLVSATKAGKVPFFTTPSGHRRFARSDIEALRHSHTATVVAEERAEYTVTKEASEE